MATTGHLNVLTVADCIEVRDTSVDISLRQGNSVDSGEIPVIDTRANIDAVNFRAAPRIGHLELDIIGDVAAEATGGPDG